MQEINNPVFLGLSGGLDSTTLLAKYLYENRVVYPVFFKYPSTHNEYELDAAITISKYYHQTLRIIDVSKLFAFTESGLLVNQTSSNNEIKLGAYDQETMATTVVPGRNLIFSSTLASMAQSVGRSTIALAVHSGDHNLYPDCREDWVLALSHIIRLQSEGIVNVDTPFSAISKKAIAELALKLNVPIELTRSCYSSQGTPCNKCGTCIERNAALAMLKK